MKRILFIIISFIAIASSCEHHTYETGDGELSYLRAEYADMVVSNGVVASITTDDGVGLTPSEPLDYPKDMPRDTLLRYLVYYNSLPDVNTVELLKLTPVTVVKVKSHEEAEVMASDPVKMTAAWKSNNQKYLNLQIGIMTGNDTENVQELQIVCENQATTPSDTVKLILRHNQADVPQYYTEDIYLSIPLDVYRGKANTISITIPTYNGEIKRSFSL